MGKILIIKGADFSAVAISKVEPGGGETISWNPTRIGQYIGETGTVVNNARYDSMITPLTPGKTYTVHQQSNDNNIRVFNMQGGTYTQVTFSKENPYSYTCPSDKTSYVIQTIFDHDIEGQYPNTPYIVVS